jgi:YHS domain-containing protein
MMAGIILTGLALFSGCARKQPAARPTPPTSGQEPVAAQQAEVKAAAAQQAEIRTAAAEQTTCPVMGGAIDKTIFVEYKGKKVYFCCKGCPQTFLANPEKYLAKLPQFQN